MRIENWIHGWLNSIWKKKEVPNYRREKNLAKLFNQEKNLLQQKREKKVFEIVDFKDCGCLPDCGCKE